MLARPAGADPSVILSEAKDLMPVPQHGDRLDRLLVSCYPSMRSFAALRMTGNSMETI
jgi:hypothetical protein